MITLILNFWYLFLLVFFLGVFFAVTFAQPFKKLCRDFISKAPIIRKYWSFVIPFSLILGIIYFLIFKYVAQSDISNYLSLVGQIAALVFAIFVGYFAFLQLVESRVTNLKQKGYEYFKKRAYTRAIGIYEQVISIDTKDFYNFAELLELYLIQKDFVSFDEKIKLLEGNALDKKDYLMLFYLKISKDLLREHLAEAKEQITKLVDFKKKDPSILVSWDFTDIQNSPPYIALPAGGEAKTIFVNLIQYLTPSMEEGNRDRFEGGNYSLQ